MLHNTFFSYQIAQCVNQLQMGQLTQQSSAMDSFPQGGGFADRQEAGASERVEWDQLFHDIDASRQAELIRPHSASHPDQQVSQQFLHFSLDLLSVEDNPRS